MSFVWWWAATLAAAFAVAAQGTPAYRNMPEDASGNMPVRLSQTGVFADTARLIPAEGLVPYELKVSFWSDGAFKSRWIALPSSNNAPSGIKFAPNDFWQFPAGTIFVKHFELGTDQATPDQRRRLETRLLVRDRTGGVYGVTYKWRPDRQDADLLTTNLDEEISISATSGLRTQAWHYPSREECLTCHSEKAGGVLGVTTRQLNRMTRDNSGSERNQLMAWNLAGMFAPALDVSHLASFPRLAATGDHSRSLEDRARSYLDANCANCHRPGGTVAYFDARYETPVSSQGLLDGQILIDQGLDGARVIAPRDPWRSILLLRLTATDGRRMPPLAHQEIDVAGAALIQSWIESLPGPRVVSPPSINPTGGSFKEPIEVRISHAQTNVTIHFTLDGSAPSKSDPVYAAPIRVTGPTVVRARAFEPGATKSIAVQEVYDIGG